MTRKQFNGALLALLGLVTFIVTACGGDDVGVNDPNVGSYEWNQFQDPWTRETFHCIIQPQGDAMWCHQP